MTFLSTITDNLTQLLTTNSSNVKILAFEIWNWGKEHVHQYYIFRAKIIWSGLAQCGYVYALYQIGESIQERACVKLTMIKASICLPRSANSKMRKNLKHIKYSKSCLKRPLKNRQNKGLNPFTAVYKCTLYAGGEIRLFWLWCYIIISYKNITNVGIYTKFFPACLRHLVQCLK